MEKGLEQWDAEIKQQSLHLKHDYQLVQMEESLTAKIPRVLKDLNDILRFPDAKKKEIYDTLVEGGEIEALVDSELVLPQEAKDKIDAELQHEIDFYQTKWQRLNNIHSLISKEQELRKTGEVKRKPLGTTYYIDFNNGHDVDNDGTSATKTNGDGPWATLDKFCESGRSAGDKAIVRRGMTQTVTSDLTFLSDGAITNPIILEADYANAFGDDVDLSATATAILIFGSKTITFSADISGVLAAGDWIYASGDAAKEFAYEVASVSTVTVTLHLPYKGGQAGSGKTMTNMKAAPIWNTTAGDYEVNLDSDNYWKFQGLHLRGTATNGVFEFDSVRWAEWYDCIFEGNGTGDRGIRSSVDNVIGWCQKCRFFNYGAGIECYTLAQLYIRDCLFDGNGIGPSAFSLTHGVVLYVDNCEFKNHTVGDFRCSTWAGKTGQIFKLRNCLLSSATEWGDFTDVDATPVKAYSEDHNQVKGDNRQFMGISDGAVILQSETSEVRSGGGATSIKVIPVVDMSVNLKIGRLLLFEYPIYAEADAEKTFTVYFKSSGTGNWTDDPLNTELWIEAEYWGHGSNNHRKLTKSTGVCDFNGDDTTWHTLTVTVTPLQTGVLYLRGFYCKTKEAAKSNIFYTDTKIGIA